MGDEVTGPDAAEVAGDAVVAGAGVGAAGGLPATATVPGCKADEGSVCVATLPVVATGAVIGLGDIETTAPGLAEVLPFAAGAGWVAVTPPAEVTPEPPCEVPPAPPPLELPAFEPGWATVMGFRAGAGSADPAATPVAAGMSVIPGTAGGRGVAATSPPPAAAGACCIGMGRGRVPCEAAEAVIDRRRAWPEPSAVGRPA